MNRVESNKYSKTQELEPYNSMYKVLSVDLSRQRSKDDQNKRRLAPSEIVKLHWEYLTISSRLRKGHNQLKKTHANPLIHKIKNWSNRRHPFLTQTSNKALCTAEL